MIKSNNNVIMIENRRIEKHKSQIQKRLKQIQNKIQGSPSPGCQFLHQIPTAISTRTNSNIHHNMDSTTNSNKNSLLNTNHINKKTNVSINRSAYPRQQQNSRLTHQYQSKDIQLFGLNDKDVIGKDAYNKITNNRAIYGQRPKNHQFTHQLQNINHQYESQPVPYKAKRLNNQHNRQYSIGPNTKPQKNYLKQYSQIMQQSHHDDKQLKSEHKQSQYQNYYSTGISKFEHKRNNRPALIPSVNQKQNGSYSPDKILKFNYQQSKYASSCRLQSPTTQDKQGTHNLKPKGQIKKNRGNSKHTQGQNNQLKQNIKYKEGQQSKENKYRYSLQASEQKTVNEQVLVNTHKNINNKEFLQSHIGKQNKKQHIDCDNTTKIVRNLTQMKKKIDSQLRLSFSRCSSDKQYASTLGYGTNKILPQLNTQQFQADITTHINNISISPPLIDKERSIIRKCNSNLSNYFMPRINTKDKDNIVSLSNQYGQYPHKSIDNQDIPQKQSRLGHIKRNSESALRIGFHQPNHLNKANKNINIEQDIQAENSTRKYQRLINNLQRNNKKLYHKQMDQSLKKRSHSFHHIPQQSGISWLGRHTLTNNNSNINRSNNKSKSNSLLKIESEIVGNEENIDSANIDNLGKGYRHRYEDVVALLKNNTASPTIEKNPTVNNYHAKTITQSNFRNSQQLRKQKKIKQDNGRTMFTFTEQKDQKLSENQPVNFEINKPFRNRQNQEDYYKKVQQKAQFKQISMQEYDSKFSFNGNYEQNKSNLNQKPKILENKYSQYRVGNQQAKYKDYTISITENNIKPQPTTQNPPQSDSLINHHQRYSTSIHKQKLKLYSIAKTNNNRQGGGNSQASRYVVSEQDRDHFWQQFKERIQEANQQYNQVMHRNNKFEHQHLIGANQLQKKMRTELITKVYGQANQCFYK